MIHFTGRKGRSKGKKDMGDMKTVRAEREKGGGEN
jgi:hypothetical protein